MDGYRVKPSSRVDLSQWNPDDKNAFAEGKEEGHKQLLQLKQRLEELQERLYAAHKHKVLIVLQAMDTGGKDGVIRHVFEGVNPQGVRVVNFKKPTTEELDHDFLWRVHKQVPCQGEIVIFNRSHYEDVLVVRVHHLMPQSVWAKRYEHINNFERMLADEGINLDAFAKGQVTHPSLGTPEKPGSFAINALACSKFPSKLRLTSPFFTLPSFPPALLASRFGIPELHRGYDYGILSPPCQYPTPASGPG